MRPGPEFVLDFCSERRGLMPGVVLEQHVSVGEPLFDMQHPGPLPAVAAPLTMPWVDVPSALDEFYFRNSLSCARGAPGDARKTQPLREAPWSAAA